MKRYQTSDGQLRFHRRRATPRMSVCQPFISPIYCLPKERMTRYDRSLLPLTIRRAPIFRALGSSQNGSCLRNCDGDSWPPSAATTPPVSSPPPSSASTRPTKPPTPRPAPAAAAVWARRPPSAGTTATASATCARPQAARASGSTAPTATACSQKPASSWSAPCPHKAAANTSGCPRPAGRCRWWRHRGPASGSGLAFCLSLAAKVEDKT